MRSLLSCNAVIKALGEPVVDLDAYRARLVATALLREQPGELIVARSSWAVAEQGYKEEGIDMVAKLRSIPRAHLR